MWSESRQRAKKLSKRVIATELRTKGVSQDIINEVIEEIDDETEYLQAFNLAQRKYKSIAHLDPEVVYRRISGLLARKGYGHGICDHIIVTGQKNSGGRSDPGFRLHP